MVEVSQKILDEIIYRIIETVQPEKIILFGSVARGEQRIGSDLDLLIVKSGVHRRKTAQLIYKNLLGINHSVDIIVVTPEDIERYHDSNGLVIGSAIREGKIIYAT